jgi:hypothetical protein
LHGLTVVAVLSFAVSTFIIASQFIPMKPVTASWFSLFCLETAEDSTQIGQIFEFGGTYAQRDFNFVEVETTLKTGPS